VVLVLDEIGFLALGAAAENDRIGEAARVRQVCAVERFADGGPGVCVRAVAGRLVADGPVVLVMAEGDISGAQHPCAARAGEVFAASRSSRGDGSRNHQRPGGMLSMATAEDDGVDGDVISHRAGRGVRRRDGEAAASYGDERGGPGSRFGYRVRAIVVSGAQHRKMIPATVPIVPENASSQHETEFPTGTRRCPVHPPASARGSGRRPGDQPLAQFPQASGGLGVDGVRYDVDRDPVGVRSGEVDGRRVLVER
jgi:hypothetical protein